MNPARLFYITVPQKSRLVPVIALQLFFLMAFAQLGHSQTNSDGNGKPPKKEEGKEKSDGGGFIGDATRKLFEDHDARLLGNLHRINILPIGYYDFRTGVNLGLFSRIQSKQGNPYLYRLTLQFIASHKGSHKHKVVFEYPHIGQSQFGLKFYGEWERDLEARYFGVGNSSQFDENFTDSGSEEFIDSDFYIYNLKHPQLAIHGLRRLTSNLVFWFGFGVEHAQPQFKNGAATSFLGTDRPFGYLGGSGQHLSFRLSYDTRADDVFPLQGTLTDFSFEPNFASVKDEVPDGAGLNVIRRNVMFYRYTFSTAQFVPVRTNRLIFANRLAFEMITGDAPYYALSEVAGEKPIHSLGGSHTLRGFPSRRFQDKIKLFTLTELRYNFRTFSMFTHSFDLIFMGFIDTGRVWDRWSEIAFESFHHTFGGGVWLNWNKKVILRVELGHSPEQTTPLIRLYTAF
jgi:hypothetical protein